MFSIKQNVDLSIFNTMGVFQKARYFVEIASLDELKEALSFAEKRRLEILVLGEGSNILFAADFTGLIILNRIEGITVIDESEENIFLKCGAGENWHNLVLFCVERGWGGIENLALIPGTIGAAPIQNIGAYGVEFNDVFVVLEALEITSQELKLFNKKKM